MDFLKLAQERYSVRKFKSEPLEKKEIDTILKVAHLAPTGCNFQPHRILVINTDNSVKKLKECTKCHFDAPCAMLVCFDKNEGWHRPYDGAHSAPVDGAIVATHIILAAHSIGVGTCWVMHFNPEKMKETYNIPENIEPLALIVMGHAADDAPVNPYHNTFRPMEEVVYYDSF